MARFLIRDFVLQFSAISLVGLLLGLSSCVVRMAKGAFSLVDIEGAVSWACVADCLMLN